MVVIIILTQVQSINLIESNFDIFHSSKLPWTRPWTPLFYHILVALFSKILHIDPLYGILWFNIFLFLAISLFGAVIFKDNRIISIFFLLTISLKFPIYKYRPFTFFFFAPIFFTVFYYYFFVPLENNQSVSGKTFILLGILMGLLFYSHTTSLVAILTFLIIYIFYLIQRKKLNAILNILLIFLISLPFALLYWWWPLVNKFHAKNPITYYGYFDFSRPNIALKTAVNNSLSTIHFLKLDIFTPIFVVYLVLSLSYFKISQSSSL